MLLPNRIVPFPEDEAQLYQALGLALTRWQHIETAMYLGAFFLMKTDHKACATAFFHIKSAESKFSLVEKLIGQAISQHERQIYWKPLSKEISDIIDFRNALAHFEVFFLTDYELKKINPQTKYRYALAPHHLDPSHSRGGSVKLLSVEQMRTNADEMKKATYYLIYFIIDHIKQSEQQILNLEPRLLQWFESFRKGPRPIGFEPLRKTSPLTQSEDA